MFLFDWPRGPVEFYIATETLPHTEIGKEKDGILVFRQVNNFANNDRSS